MPNQNKNQNSNSKSVNKNVQGDLFTSKLVRGVPISEEVFDVPASTNQPIAQSKPSHALRNILYGITAGIILLLAFATFWFYRAAHTTNKTAADYGTTSADIAALTSAKTVTANGFVIINGNASVNGSVTANSFSGNGADLSNVNATRLNSQPGSFYQDASNMDTGTLNDARLSGNVVLLGSSPNFTNLLVTGTTTLQDTLAVSGAATFQTTVSVGGDLTVTGDTNINGLTYNWPATQASGVLSNDGSGNLAWQPVGACASCITDGGNAFGGSISVGTNDANSLYLRTNGVDQVTLNTSGNLGIGVNPGYKLDVNGDVNVSAGNAFRIGGTAICTSGGCVASAGSTDYVQNSASLQTGVNFNFEIASINSVGGIIRAKAGQVSDLQQWQSSGGVALAYVDAAGDFNANSALKVNGTTVCTASGCTAAGGSGSYIQNGTALQTNANFNIQTVNAASIGGIIKGAVGQSVSLQEWQDSTGFTLALIDTNGAFLVQDNAGDYANVTPNDITLFNTNNYTTVAPGVIGAASNLDSSFTQIAPYTIYFGWTNGQVSSLQLTAQQVLALDVNTRFNIGKTLAVNSTGTLGTVERFRVNTPTTVDNLANVMIATTATTSKGLVIQAKASQTANLQEWQSSTGTQIGAVDASGRFVANTLGSADNATYLCRNSSNQIATCSGTASGTAFVQGGNSFGATGILGTNDANALQINTGGTARATLTNGNILYLGNANTSGTASTPNAFSVLATSSSTAGTTGGSLTIKSGAGAITTTGSAGGQLILAGNDAGGSGNNAGGGVSITTGNGTGSGNGGAFVFTGGTSNSGTGGSFSATTGSGTNGSGGAIVLRAGDGFNGNGGSVTILSGAGYNGSSGTLTLDAGFGDGAGIINIGTSYGYNLNIGVNGGTNTINGNLKVQNLGTTNTATYLCRNSSNIIAACNTTGSGAAFVNGGNSFAGAATLGTNDTNTLSILTNGVTRETYDTTNNVYFGNGITNASPAAFAINATGGSGTNIAGAALTLAGGKGTGTGVGGNIVFQYAPAGSTGAALNTLSTACTISGTNGSLSCPGAGAGSERFGAGATAAGGSSAVFGNSASASAGSAVSIGLNASAGGTTGSVAIGASSNASVTGAIAIGNSATSSGSGNVAIGNSATASFGNNVAIGQSASASGSSASAFGAGTSAGHTGAIALGVGATTTAANQLVIGSNTQSITSTFIGNGVTNAAPAGITINATGGSGTNIAGASLTLASGIGTGTGNGGNINFQVAKPGTTGSSANSLATIASFSGVNGSAILQNSTNSSTALQVKNAAGSTTVFNVDTTNNRVGINTVTPTTALTIEQNGSQAAVTGLNIYSNPLNIAIYNGGSNNGHIDFTSGWWIGSTSGQYGGTLYAGASITATAKFGNITLDNVSNQGNTVLKSSSIDVFTLYGIDRNLYIGNGVTNVAPAGQKIIATGGSGTNIAGASLTLAGGIGTGTGLGGGINFQTSAAGTSGASLNALSTVMSLAGGTGVATFQNTVDSAGALRVLQAAGGTPVLDVNTSNTSVGINATATTGVPLTVNSNTVVGSIQWSKAALNITQANNPFLALTGANSALIGAFNVSNGAIPLLFYNGGTETMRLSSGGVLEIGSTGTPGTVEKFRVNTPATVDNLANAMFTTSATTSKGLVIQGLASQTANLQEWQSSTGTVLASVSAGGSITGDTIQGVNLVASSSFRTSGTIANSGAIRLANTNNIAWRNAANTGNITAGVNASDILQITSPAADGTTVAQFNNAGATNCTVQPGGTGFACSSDARLKTNILTLNNSSDIVNKLRGVSFNWVSNPTGQIQSGFIAQELMQVIPGAVSQDSNGFYVANYSAIVPYLVNAFQDSDKRLTALEAKVNDIQLSQGVFSGGIVTGDTVFQAKATFDGLASFKGQTVFAGGATFEGVTNVKGRLQLSNNNTGVATIPNGGNSVHVALPSTFSAAPNINLTPQDFVTGQYRVTHVTTTGFDIETSASQSENITFYWQAF